MIEAIDRYRDSKYHYKVTWQDVNVVAKQVSASRLWKSLASTKELALD